MTTYTIEIQDAAGNVEALPLTARSDAMAIKQLKAWIAANSTTGAQIYLSFFRSSDHQRGYLNPHGASRTGRAWPTRPKGRPAGAIMPCGWCARPLTARAMRAHFANCPNRPPAAGQEPAR